ncbi:putative NRPS-like protein biosynthetic cluster [Aspergillus melleus]|uniref:NRPS-like protein biosynthetic cluster n=1 Tax=Aspergillus melleus TaxID=138277 RepID=A0ACC3BFH0_9EURO|nr:putative NRPS-like protein biosynthetic cluster [Aspergillus melleus]
MDGYLSSHAIIQPDDIAIENGPHVLSYRELDREVGKLASVLNELHLSIEQPICVLEDIGPSMVIAQLAALRARLTCVPITPSTPELRLLDMLQDIDARYILTDQNAPDNEDITIIPISGHSSEETVACPPSRDRGGEFRSHILYTSGSSGKPKAVQIAERSLLHLAENSPVTPLHPKDRMAVVNNPGFDISLFEIFAPLAAGATLVIVPREACPTAFVNARHVLTAGEVANKAAMRAVLESSAPPEHLWNTYGPTEATTFSTMHLVTLGELEHENIAIGKSIGNTELCLVDEHSNIITEPGQMGEILLGGPGLTIGYIGRPEENQDGFVTLDGIRYYRTGDMAKWRQDDSGVLDFVGRVDLQVKHGGFRIELEEIEQVLLSSTHLSGAAVVQVPPTDLGHEPLLVVFVIPCIANSIRPRDITTFSQERLPAYMVPQDIFFCSNFTLTEHGKVDRNALVQRYIKEREEKAQIREQEGGNNLHSVVEGIWSALLNKPTINEDDDFFILGGTSIQAATLIARLRQQLGKTVSMRSLHENSRLRDLVNHLEEFTEGGNAAPNEAETWAHDAHIADSLEALPEWQDTNEGRVFVTGATGFVGAHFLSRFLQLPAIKEIVCLARSKDNVSPIDRVHQALRRYDLWDDSARPLKKLLVLEGDVGLDHLGLTKENFIWLTNWASTVFHFAAKVNFCEPYESHFDANILGTKNVLEAALSGRRKSFHYMSSIDTWGPTGLVLGTRKVLEDDPLEPHVRGLPFDIGYAQSKWVAEQIVRRARTRGLPTAIYRPGFVIGDSRDGSSNPDDFFARLMVGSIRLGAFPILPNQRMEYVTIDYACDVTLHIASQNKNLGKSYSLVAPDPADSVNLEKTVEVIREAGYLVEHIPYWEWVQRLQSGADKENPLLPVMPLLQEPVLCGLSRFETSRNTPHYDSSNTVTALKDVPEISYIPFTSGMLNKFLNFWDRKGFYETRQVRN